MNKVVTVDTTKPEAPGSAVAVIPQPSAFREVAKRFVAGPDDARGYLALGLFLCEALDRTDPKSEDVAVKAMREISDTSISVVYYSAAKRLLDTYADKQLAKRVDEQVGRDRLYMLLNQNFEAKAAVLRDAVENGFSQLAATIQPLAHSQTFGRQTLTTAAAATVVVGIAAILTFGPDLATAIKHYFF
jgi:hypothetical protein